MRPTGWLKDARDTRDKTMSDLVRAPFRQNVPTSDLSAARSKRLEQGFASSCVSFAKARAVQLATALAGQTLHISCSFDYHIARRQEWAGFAVETLPPLEDRGSFPRLSMTATRQVGFVPDSSLPYDDTRVNDPLSTDLFLEAFPLRSLTYYRIDETGPARLAAAQLALSRGYPVIFGMAVDRAFVDHQGESVIADIDASAFVGLHMMAVLAASPSGVLIDNWWGKDWGSNDGTATLSANLFCSAFIDDVYAITAVPPT